MKLQILVPHYNEPFEVVKPLLDSIAMQQNVDFDQIGVIISHDKLPENDGYDDFVFCDGCDGYYPFKIEQIYNGHKGVSSARNLALYTAKAEYVMFCDCDDMFYNLCGLWLIFREIETGEFDSLVSAFVEETRVDGKPEYVKHDMDSTFVHGKIHRLQYLKDNKIRWNDELTIHEDSYFNILCQSLSDNVKYCPTPFYLWKWRDESVCRHDPKYILKTYKNMIDSNDSLVEQFLSRTKTDKAKFYVAFMLFDAYYTMNKPEWINQENKQYRNDTENRFRDYYKKYRNLWDGLSINEKMLISNGVRTRNVMEGMQMEKMTIEEWLTNL